jgi:hypothetical protein
MKLYSVHGVNDFVIRCGYFGNGIDIRKCFTRS